MSFEIDKAAASLSDRNRILVFTGAGISTESGIPDFRGTNGIWTKLDPEDFMLDRYLNDAAVRERAWKARFPKMFGGAAPNPAHQAVATLWRTGRMIGCVTQNIDGLHQAAGLPATAIAELHGNADGIACIECHRPADPADVQRRWESGESDPRCATCHGILKATVVFFGEMLPQDQVDRANRWAAAADAVIVVGSSLSVYPAAYIPLDIASHGAPFVLINEGPTELDDMTTVRLTGKAGVLLPELVAALA